LNITINKIYTLSITVFFSVLPYTFRRKIPTFRRNLLPLSSAMLVHFHQIIRCHNPDDSILHIQRRKDLKSQWKKYALY